MTTNVTAKRAAICIVTVESSVGGLFPGCVDDVRFVALF